LYGENQIQKTNLQENPKTKTQTLGFDFGVFFEELEF